MTVTGYDSSDAGDVRTLAELLRRRATLQPDRIAYVFLAESGQQETPLTYAQLDRRARLVAARMRASGTAVGERALLLYPPGPDFVAALFGCAYAGVVAVPTFPPDPARLNRTLPRLLATITDAEPALALTQAPLVEVAASIVRSAGGTRPVRWLAADGDPDSDPDGDPDWVPPATGPDDLALLQYTSGSTGSPKGVMLTHGNLLHNSRVIQEVFGTGGSSRGLSWLPPYHDMGLIGGLIQPLYAGLPIWLMSPLEFLRRPMSWLESLSRLGATVSGGPNFAYDLCVARSAPAERERLDLSSWQVAFNGAEPVRRGTLERFAAAFAPAGFRAESFLPCYGLAEATLIVSGGSARSVAGDVDPVMLETGVVEPAAPGTAQRLVGCGRGAADQHILIVDPRTGHPCPPDRVGEVWLRGPSVAAGYWGRPDETREVFGAQPTGVSDADGGYLRTGDLGFLRAAELVVTGRLKDLIIVRGRNHHPQDLELTAEQAHPSLRRGGTAAFLLDGDGYGDGDGDGDGDGAERVVLVHEIARGAEGVDLAEVAGAVRRRVAEQHDLQVGVVVLIPAGMLPKTTSGKVRRSTCRRLLLAGDLGELARSEGATRARAAAPVPSRAALLAVPVDRRAELVERYLRDRVEAACGLSCGAVVPDEPLLAAGLDSLAAQQLRQEVESDLGAPLPLAEVLAGASASAVAAALAARIGDRAGVTALRRNPAALPAGVPGPSELTPGQRALWFTQQLTPDSTAHTTVAAFRLVGPLDVVALRGAFDDLVTRHPALRATFGSRDGEPVQEILPQASGGFRTTDAGGLDDPALAARLATDAHRPFDLAAGPVIRLELYRRTADEHVVLLTAHHLVTDFWSTMILGREFAARYAERTGPSPAAPMPPAPGVAEVRSGREATLSGPSAARSARHWAEQIGDGVPALDLPTRTAVRSAGDAGGMLRFRVDPELTARLRRRAAAEGVTLNVLLLAGYQALLHLITGQNDLVVGAPLASRGRCGATEVVGYLMNPVPLRSRTEGGSTFRDLLLQTREQVIGALEHQDHLGAHPVGQGSALRRGSLDAMFVFNRPTATDAGTFGAVLLGHAGVCRPFGALRAESLAVELRESAFDVELSLSELDRVVHGWLRHRSDALDGPAARRLSEQYLAVLDRGSADPGARLGTLVRATGAELTRIVEEWNATDSAVDSTVGVDRLFARQARRTPDAVAVVADTGSFTYAELDERANQLAHHLRASGVGAGSRVGICLDRAPAMVTAVLGVLKAGAAYVPVDPLNPADRIAATFADATVAVVLGQRSLAAKMPQDGAPVILLDADEPAIRSHPGTAPEPCAAPGDPAYVIYTSGSTGTPKGVVISHRALSNYTQHAIELFGLAPADRVLQFFSIGFDASVEEIFPTLACGACLVLRTDAMLASPQVFLAGCADRAVSVISLPMGFWHDLVSALETGTATLPQALRLVVVGAESASPRRLAVWGELVGNRVRLLNTYGPTEATITATTHELTGLVPGATVPIGRPVANNRAYVLDDDCAPVSVGAVGELYLGGIGLAEGYLSRSGLTAERFVADPFGPPGGRLYRTGDLARYSPDGALLFVGRADRQVKVNGYRVELGEIESALREIRGVADAVVVWHRRLSRLVAFVVPAEEGTGTDDVLRARLRSRLPGYMVPARYVPLPALPRTTGGKVDLAALAADPLAEASWPAEPPDPPRTASERLLAELWREVLDRDEFCRNDDFFALGGHSLLAGRMLARFNAALGIDLPLRAVFESPTLSDLAARAADAPRARLEPVPTAPRDQPLPLSYVQEGIWFLQQLEPASTSYNVPRALRLRGEVDPGTARRALADLEVRHEILRTTFPDFDGEPVQRIHEPHGIPVTVLDRRDLPAAERAAWIEQRVRTAGQEPFDLAVGPLLRVTLVRLADDEYVLIVVEHHLIHDGWAQGVFLRDFLELYEAHATGRPPRLPELPIQYADFAAWQRRTVQGERLDALEAHWRLRLAGVPPRLLLPTDRPRPRVLSSRGAQETLELDGELAAALRALGRRHDATLFMTMLTAFAALLHAYSGQDDIVLGSGLANRQRPELENLIGMIINTVLLRADLSGDPSFVQLQDRVRETCLDAYAHQDMPFEKLVERLRPARSLSHMPLFQAMFSFLDTPMPALRLPGVSLEVLDAHNNSAKFDLNAVVIPHSEQRLRDAVAASPDGDPAETITVLLEYNADLFDPPTVRGMLDRYHALLRCAVARPEVSLTALIGEAGLPDAARIPS